MARGLLDRSNDRLPLPAILAERWLAVAVVLALIAALTQWIAWLNADDAVVDTFVGPPRSDYTLANFTLTTFDASGRFQFAVEAPRLVKHPYVGSLEIDAPQFRIRDAKGLDWNARSDKGYVDGRATVLELAGAVALHRPEQATTGPVSVRSESLVAHVDTNTVTSDVAVTVEQPGSILKGNGLVADLDARRFRLERGTSARFVPRAARAPRA